MSRKTNRDHGKKTHRPMVEDSEIASQLEDLLTPAIAAQASYYRQLKLRVLLAAALALPYIKLAVDDGSDFNTNLARCGGSYRIN